MKLTKTKKAVIALAALAAAAAVILLSLYFAGIIKYAEPAEGDGGKYLFCYFTGNEPEHEKINFAVSDDGYNFKALNGNEPVIENTSGTLSVRDPYILKGQNGKYYIIGTDMKCEDGWTSNHALVTWESDDLINWSEPSIIDIRGFGGEFANTNRAWAPQAVWDEEAGSYMVYWANSTQENDCAAIYYAYTDDFKSITKPALLYAREGIQTIDADIIYNSANGRYYMYFKHDEDSTIAYVTSDSLTGPYTGEPQIVSLASSGVEGSSMYSITGTDAWVMIMDEYGKGRYVAQQTTDFESFAKLKRSDYAMDFGARHGAVVNISDEEYSALINTFGAE